MRDKELADLKLAQELAEKIEKNMQSSGKSHILGHTRGNNSCNKDTKGKSLGLEEKGNSKYSMEKLTNMIKKLSYLSKPTDGQSFYTIESYAK